MDLRPLLLPRGYLHRTDLVEAGWSPDRLRAAVQRESIVVERRQWLLLPEANPVLHAAARCNGRVTCVSALIPLGLWEPSGGDTRPHIALAPHSSAACAEARVHRGLGVLPPHPRTLLDPVENALGAVALCLPFDAALAVWESALNRRLVAPAHLDAILWPSLPARRLARAATSASDSGLETRFVWRLRRAGLTVRQQVVIAGRPVDALVGTRLVIQLDGFAHHSSARQRRSDLAHDRALRLLGYTVFRYDFVEVMNETDRVEEEVLRAVAQGLHLARRS